MRITPPFAGASTRQEPHCAAGTQQRCPSLTAGPSHPAAKENEVAKSPATFAGMARLGVKSRSPSLAAPGPPHPVWCLPASSRLVMDSGTEPGPRSDSTRPALPHCSAPLMVSFAEGAPPSCSLSAGEWTMDRKEGAGVEMIPFCALGHSAKICEHGQLPVMTGGRWLIPGRLLSYTCHPDLGDGQTSKHWAETSHREEAGVGKSIWGPCGNSLSILTGRIYRGSDLAFSAALHNLTPSPASVSPREVLWEVA